MRKLFTLSFLALIVTVASAQENLIRCYTVEAEQERRNLYPIESTQDFENWISAKIAQQNTRPSSGRAILTIPIVFHIIHNGDALGSNENITQAQVNSQLTVLNEDFRRMMGTPGYNTNPVGADTEIEFCMAVVDPNGNILAEPGIDRRNMTQASWQRSTGAANDIEGVLKPQTIWDPTKYFNIWVVNFGGNSSSLLGYAQFPNSTLQGIGTNNGGANTDGVVVRFRSLGSVGNVATPYHKGRTLTHEIGHAFGLRHIWGDGSNCNASDFCDDTPKASAANYGCPTKNSCADPAPDPNDMVQNYMDYSDDLCMNIFTANQKTRMVTVLTNSVRRASLTTSNVCNIPSTFSYTGRVIDAANSQGIAGASVLATGAATYNLTTDANGDFSIPNMIGGNYTIYAGKWSYKTNALAQANYNSSTSPVTLALQKGYYDDFTFDFGWTVSNNATSGAWVRGEPVGTTFAANNVTVQSNPEFDVTPDYTDKCYVTGNAGGQAGTDDVDGGTTTLTSPTMDLTGFSEPILKYYRWFFNGGGTGTPDDSLIVSIVNGSQTVVLDRIGSSAGSSSQWNSKSYKVKDFVANPGANVRITVRTFDSATGHLVEGGFDMFQVEDSVAPVPVKPTANYGTSSNIICAGSTVTYSNFSSNNPTSLNWNFPGGSPASSSAQNPTITYNIPGTYEAILIASNQYGSDTTKVNIPVTVSAVVAAFTQDVIGGCPGTSIKFNQVSTCAPTAYKWIFNGGNPATATSDSVSVAYNQAGIYDVTLIASNQYGADTITKNLAVEIYAPPATIYSFISDTNNTAVGAASVSVDNGFGPFTYEWSTGAITESITGLSSGQYAVTVTDGKGCKTVETFNVGNVTVTSPNGIEEFIDGVRISVYPSPVSNLLFVECDKDGLALEVMDNLGRKISRYNFDRKVQIAFTDNSPGVYFLKIYFSEKEFKVLKVVKQ